MIVPSTHLAIVGGSIRRSLEFAQMFRRFGIRRDRDRNGAATRSSAKTTTCRTANHDILVREGIAVRVNARCVSGCCTGERWRGGAGRLRATGSPTIEELRISCWRSGRRPNTDDLGWWTRGGRCSPATTKATSSSTIELQTSVPGIWALGDCNGKGAFTHTAYNDFEIVASNLLDGATRRVLGSGARRYALYIDPPLGRAGLTEAEVATTPDMPCLVGTRAMARVGQCVREGRNQRADEDCRRCQFPGDSRSAVLGTGGDEVIHCVLDTMYAKAPYTVLQRAMHIHPTVSEYDCRFFWRIDAAGRTRGANYRFSSIILSFAFLLASFGLVVAPASHRSTC